VLKNGSSHLNNAAFLTPNQAYCKGFDFSKPISSQIVCASK
jgi:hypothetical protein